MPDLPTHCTDCDRPELCDIIARGTAPCGQNAGLGPAAVKIVSDLRGEIAKPRSMTVRQLLDALDYDLTADHDANLRFALHELLTARNAIALVRKAMYFDEEEHTIICHNLRILLDGVIPPLPRKPKEQPNAKPQEPRSPSQDPDPTDADERIAHDRATWETGHGSP